MSYTYQLKSHQDIGWNNFFAIFEEDYEAQHDGSNSFAEKYLNEKLKPFNATISINNSSMECFVTFAHEDDFSWFLMRFS